MDIESFSPLRRVKKRIRTRSSSSSSSSVNKLFSYSCFSFKYCFSSSSYKISAGDDCMPDLQNVNEFSFSELEAATNSFHPSTKIGEGGFGSVYKVQDTVLFSYLNLKLVVYVNDVCGLVFGVKGRLQDGQVVAVKVLSAESKQGEREFMSEIASMSSISHENLVNLRGGCINGPFRILVYDYMENGNLSRTLSSKSSDPHNTTTFDNKIISWKVRLDISIGIAQGLAHIHEEINPCIVHRDIKASNILLDHKFTPKISDFGLSKLFPENISRISTRVAGTLGYLAPEYAFSGHLTRKSDVYSFGVLLLEIVSGRKAIDFDLELGEHFLVDKAWDMYKNDMLLQLVDPLLEGNFAEAEAIRFLKVGLLCVQEKCGLRPNMSTALKLMRNEIDFSSNKDITKPGLVRDFMNVKIGQKQLQSS
ncbi:hypothetical protein K2173_011667 [Erythroxylum novogranatense]|uniref:Protein kinase domain-containing protein n=1 Tax=Erythroxylum novogranatense TaxID=1862640 RepID=A0AAV8T0I4_9ROSI|nr:hypothetical protein K2173_011667 [Erythroxylum novogranatense]